MYIPEFVKTYGLICLIVISSFWFASRFIEPPPPKEFTIATGAKTGDYYRFALAYKKVLEKEGIALHIRETAGSEENIKLLEGGEADFAFIQSGLFNNQEKIESLASLYYEPLWVFTNLETLPEKDLQNLKGSQIAIGAKGSGSYAIAHQLLGLNGITDDTVFLEISGQDAAEALQKGKVSAAFFVSRASAPLIQELLQDPNLKLLSFTRAGGYTSQLPYLSEVKLKEGVVDLANNIPDQQISLLSPVAQLAARSDFSGALKTLMVQTATKIHTNGDIFTKKGTFPALKYVDFPSAEEAVRYFKYGPNILQRVLPFWLADTISRMVVMLIPLIGIMLPLLKIASPAYRWRTRSRIYKWYKSLKTMEDMAGAKDEDIKEAMTALERIDADVRKTKVPLSYSDELYNLRLHIQMIREHLKRL